MEKLAMEAFAAYHNLTDPEEIRLRWNLYPENAAAWYRVAEVMNRNEILVDLNQ